jgi:hypothetical protein
LVKFRLIIHKTTSKKWFLSKIKLGKDSKNINYRVLHQEGHCVAFFNYYFNRKNNKKHYIGNCSDITEFVENQQKTTTKEVLRNILVYQQILPYLI